MQHIVIGSRGSDLALWQAHFVEAELKKLGCTVEITIIKTQGDAIQHLSFDKLEGKGFFTKEIEDALLNRSIDLAVHSHKDLETNPPAGLKISCVSYRANPADLLLIRKESVNNNNSWDLKEKAVVGTSSARRKSQVLRERPDVELKDLRGNVPTRIDKLRQGLYDAIILAKAGVDRLELDLGEFEAIELSPTAFIPAPAQGVLGLQIREDDHALHELLQAINHPDVQEKIELERAVLNKLQGGCQLPLGAYCDSDTLHISYAQTALDAGRIFRFPLKKDDNFVDKVVAHLLSEVQI